MGTNETVMAWIYDEIGRAVGLPALLGGIPLDEIGATGFGVAVCAEALHTAGRLGLAGARTAIQGFGAVGGHAALQLAKRGARVVAVSDIRVRSGRGDGRAYRHRPLLGGDDLGHGAAPAALRRPAVPSCG
jgi:glutamate dehydrogenase/leucine dehydrogenase